jgi:sugar phosphate isomerase/epimerase
MAAASPKTSRIAEGPFCRRSFLTAAAALAAGGTLGASLLRQARAEDASRFRMKACLTPGSIGVRANQREAVDLAERYGFDAVEPFGGYLASLSNEQQAELVDDVKARNLTWGAAGLPVEFRRDAAAFREGMKELPKIAEALSRAGADRVGTWLMPSHPELTYMRNFRQHAERLREVASVLKEQGQRLGLEYVGTYTLKNRSKYPFVHTLAETQDLIAEIGTGNVGVVLDSWHWWQADDTVEDILSLKAEQVISVDLNDAPAGVEKHEQQDGRRELPGATGVIDVAAFLKALVDIGYDGPVRAEPFNQALNAMENDAACEAVSQAMRRSFERAIRSTE